MLGTLTLVGSNLLALAPVVWAPAFARTVAVTPTQPQPNSYGVQLTPNDSLAWPAKNAADVGDFSLSLTSWLIPGDIIERFSVAINDAALQLLSQTITSALASVWLAGGTPGGNASIDLTVTTGSGRVGRFTLTLPINALTPAEQAGYNPPAPTMAPGTLLGRGAGTIGPAEPLIIGPAFAVVGGIFVLADDGSGDVTQEELTAAVNSLTEETEAGDAELQEQITALQDAPSGITQAVLTAAIQVETTRATTSEATLSISISSEAAARIAADTALQSEITALQAGGGGGGGGGVTLPQNAPLLGSNSAGAAVARVLGAYMLLTGNTLSVTRTGFPINFHPGVPALPAAGLPQILCTVDVGIGEAANYPANLVGSIIKSITAPAGAYVVTMTQNGVAVVTYTWAAPHQGVGYFVPTVVSAAFSTTTDDILQWIGQATPDAGISGIRFGTYGTLQ